MYQKDPALQSDHLGVKILDIYMYMYICIYIIYVYISHHLPRYLFTKVFTIIYQGIIFFEYDLRKLSHVRILAPPHSKEKGYIHFLSYRNSSIGQDCTLRIMAGVVRSYLGAEIKTE